MAAVVNSNPSAIARISNELFSQKRILPAAAQAGLTALAAVVSAVASSCFGVVATFSFAYALAAGISVLVVSHLTDSAINTFIYPNDAQARKGSLLKIALLGAAVALSVIYSGNVLSSLNISLGTQEAGGQAILLINLLPTLQVMKFVSE